jgi:hypothetical protein
MAQEKTDLLTAGAIAKELGVSGAVVSKAIKTLDLKPELKKGACSYYSKQTLAKIKSTLK